MSESIWRRRRAVVRASLGLIAALASRGALAEPPEVVRRDDPVTVAARLARGLALTDRGFPPGARVGFGLAIDPETPAGWRSALAGALAGHLEGLGADRPFLAEDPALAVRAGAEWWLGVTARDGGLEARLVEIDRGPFGALPRPAPVRAFAEVPIPRWNLAARGPDADSVEASGGASGRPPTGDGTLGLPTPLFDWPAPIWALAYCDRRLWIVEPHRAVAVDLQRGRDVVGEASLDAALDPDPAPSRAPFARAICGPNGEVAVGTGRHAGGLRLRAEQELAMQGHLPGLPVGFDGVEWWWGERVPGRPLLSAVIGPKGPVPLEGPVHALVWAGLSGHAVDARLAVRSLTETGRFGPRLATAGTAIAVTLDRTGEQWLATSAPTLDEAVRLHSPRGHARRRIPAPITALAFARPRGRWVLLAALRADDGSQLWMVPVGGLR